MKPVQPTTPWNPESVVVVKNTCEYCDNTIVEYVAHCNVGDLYALRFLVEIKISSYCKKYESQSYYTLTHILYYKYF